MKILTVVGARPQFIKAAVISRAVIEHNTSATERIEEVIVHTGQHFDRAMSEKFFTDLNISPPRYNLGIASLSHGAMTGRMIEGLEEIIFEEKPDAVLVFGDTNSTLAGALAACKLYIPVAHVEAGLRSYSDRMPEEINRVLTDHVSRWLFCPTVAAVKNLEKEGITSPSADKTHPSSKKYVFNVGDVMYDSALYYSNMTRCPVLNAGQDVTGAEDFYLATVHRPENTDSFEKMKNIINALDEIAEGIQVIMPAHPRTRKYIAEYDIQPKRVEIIEPLGYLEMLSLIDRCKIVFTDSGGLQKEASFFNKPCVTLRDQTEWVELENSGFNILTGADKRKIMDAVERLGSIVTDYSPHHFYGDGTAGRKIISLLVESFQKDRPCL